MSMTEAERLSIAERAMAWIHEAADRIRTALPQPLEIGTKSAPNDLVTNMDKSTEQFLVAQIRGAYPEHQIISEEGFGDRTRSLEGVLWFVDPIDGTMNFVKEKQNFAISVAVYENGVPQAAFVYDVVGDEMFHCLHGSGAWSGARRLAPISAVVLEDALIDVSPSWLKRNRRIDETVLDELVLRAAATRALGAASLELAYVAAGRFDAYVTMRLSPWDYAAGRMLVEEAGGIVTRIDGRLLDPLATTSLLAGGKVLQRQISQHIRQQMAAGKMVREPEDL
ncbi:MAG: inositol monophosphatase family protein [Sporolactobacillus sp.]